MSASMLIPSVVASFNRHVAEFVNCNWKSEMGRNKKKSDYTIVEKSIILIFASCMDRRRAAFCVRLVHHTISLPTVSPPLSPHLPHPPTLSPLNLRNHHLAILANETLHDDHPNHHPHIHFIERCLAVAIVPTSTQHEFVV